MRGIVWFRRDLRVHDHPALMTACQECDEVIPLFVFDEPLLQSYELGSAYINFLLGCLQELSTSLEKLGLTLQWQRGVQADEVVRAALERKVDAVYWSRDYEPRAVARDRAVQQQLTASNIAVKTYKDHVVFEVDDLCGINGKPAQQYQAYRTRWWAKWHANTPRLRPTPQPLTTTEPGLALTTIPLPTATELGYDHAVPWIEPGEHNARKQLRRFVEGPIHQYRDGRNRPAIDCGSKLSPHFRFGTLSPRVAAHAALESLLHRNADSRPDVLAWIDELIWRDFFHQAIARGPNNIPQDTSTPPPPEQGPELGQPFQAWCNGTTGYPLIDAGMRQLQQTGWMHNHIRMIVASFLIKDLHIDWRNGARFFLRHLLDADVMINTGNWRHCAAMNIEALAPSHPAPHAFQSKQLDPQGVYIRRYLPELAKVPTHHIHEPHLMTPEEQSHYHCHIGSDYPMPIIEPHQAREENPTLGKESVAT